MNSDIEEGTVAKFISTAVSGFLNNDLMSSLQFFLKRAKGSFGLCVTSSIDAKRQLALASRGQTISVAFFPQEGMILWGSEQSAVKAAMDVVPIAQTTDPDQRAMRLDLDDLGGEIILLDFSSSDVRREAIDCNAKEDSAGSKRYKRMTSLAPSVIKGMDIRMGPLQTCTVCAFVPISKAADKDMRARMIPLRDNPLIHPLPVFEKDGVHLDIREIAKEYHRISKDWDEGKGINNLTAWTLGNALVAKLKAREGKSMRAKADDIDILVTGCEVSLWLGEQFCSDLGNAFNDLNIKCVSANKLLGTLGRDLSIPQIGHNTCKERWILKNTIVIIISHSGGTFSSLAVANLLKESTPNIFVVCSEWDTQIGKQLRLIEKPGFHSRILCTDIGLRAAEPCSLSVVCTHLLLTLLLEYLMVRLLDVVATEHINFMASDVEELAHNRRYSLKAIEEIVGYDTKGNKRPSQISTILRRHGKYIAKHITEAPKAWILSAMYIIGTVTSGYPPCISIASAAGLPSTDNLRHVFLLLDSLLYVLLPQIFAFLIRIIDGRPLFHRIAGRSIVIADIPWVSQSVEAFLSKLFACAYSNATVSVYSGNPVDHFVHRHTHRVTRGTIIIAGVPDGRLSALTGAEVCCSLAISQANAIQNYGVTPETFAIGHCDRSVSPLIAHNIVLPNTRPRYACEVLVAEQSQGIDCSRTSSHALLERYTSMKSGRSPLSHLSEVLNILKETPVVETVINKVTKKISRTNSQKYHGEHLRSVDNTPSGVLSKTHLSMILYEGRVASLERFIALCVMLHSTGANVANFWSHASAGLLGYRIDQTQSIMRIATTASPVSGSEVRERMVHLANVNSVRKAVGVIAEAMRVYKYTLNLRGKISSSTRDDDTLHGSFHGNVPLPFSDPSPRSSEGA